MKPFVAYAELLQKAIAFSSRQTGEQLFIYRQPPEGAGTYPVVPVVVVPLENYQKTRIGLREYLSRNLILRSDPAVIAMILEKYLPDVEAK